MNSNYRSKILITRVPEDGEELASHFQSLGFDTICEPMMDIIYHRIDVDKLSYTIPKYAGLIFTSRHGIRALSQEKDLIKLLGSLPVYTVGDTTALEAKKTGFSEVYSANGNVEDLKRLIPLNTKKPYLYFRGQEIAQPLADIPCAEIISYHTVMKDKFSDSFLSCLTEGHIRYATFFSLRTAEHFVKLVQNHGIINYFQPIQALCLGSSMVKSVSVLPWNTIQVAEKPVVADIVTLVREMPLDK